eukprot:m51a1_g11450 hypothetical protein (365) ;mRNA; f:13794-15284
MGNSYAHLERALEGVPDSEHFTENTCYCNATLQALWACRPLRERLIELHAESGDDEGEDEEAQAAPAAAGSKLLDELSALFHAVATSRRRFQRFEPRALIRALRAKNPMYRGDLHQDAHEFLNELLNDLADELERRRTNACDDDEDGKIRINTSSVGSTLVHSLFQGVLQNQTRCHGCDAVTTKNETFFELSVDVAPDATLADCLNHYGSTETLMGNDKFFCDSCACLQEATKSMSIRILPEILVVHMKRFKHSEDKRGHLFYKLSHRTVFPLELHVHKGEDESVLYDLFAVVVHLGSSVTHGHYVAVVNCYSKWILYDDDIIKCVDETFLRSLYGVNGPATGQPGPSRTSYLLFYKSRATLAV